jgi:threonine/homoserine efflux transporter RhtA
VSHQCLAHSLFPSKLVEVVVHLRIVMGGLLLPLRNR